MPIDKCIFIFYSQGKHDFCAFAFKSIQWRLWIKLYVNKYKQKFSTARNSLMSNWPSMAVNVLAVQTNFSLGKIMIIWLKQTVFPMLGIVKYLLASLSLSKNAVENEVELSWLWTLSISSMRAKFFFSSHTPLLPIKVCCRSNGH